jgi:hypothetical protein
MSGGIGRLEPITTIPDPLPGADPESLVEVRILRAPLRLWDRARQHTEGLVREFNLLIIGIDQADGSDRHRVPFRLVEVANSLRARYAGISDAQETELDDALERGEATRDFTYLVPRHVADACQQLLDLLDEADAYCADGELMTLVAPPDQREFRRWYLQEFIRQINGVLPTPWPGTLD